MIGRLSLATLLPLVGTMSARADGISVPDIFAGTGDDNSNRFLNMIFGPLFPGVNDETLISGLIVNFNMLFLALGLFLLVYNMIVGVTQTANDGALFGKHASALWAPIRAVVAAAMLIPLPTGYNGVQHAIAYVTKVGTGAASFFWNETAELVITQRVNVAGLDNPSGRQNLVAGIWRLELCRAAFNLEASNGPGVTLVTPQWRTPGNNRPWELVYASGDSNIGCGKIILPVKTKSFDRLAETRGANTFIAYRSQMRGLIDRFRAQIVDSAGQVAQAAAQRTSTPLRNLAGDVTFVQDEHAAILRAIVGQGSNLKSDIEALAAEEGSYRFNSVEAGDSNVVADVEIASSMRSAGWTQAGFYYQTVARVSGDTASITQALPQVQYGALISTSGAPSGSAIRHLAASGGAGLLGRWFGDANKDAQRLLENIQLTYGASLDWFYRNAENAGLREFARTEPVSGDHMSDVDAILGNGGIMWRVFEVLNPYSRSGTGDPLISLMLVGQGFMLVTAGAIGVLTLAAAVPLVGGAATALSSMLGWVIAGLGVAAVSTTFVLPLIPTLMWVLAMAAFLMLVIQSIFAGPLWAIAHLSLEGEGLAGQSARRGYLMILSIFITPTLMVIGLLASMVLFRIVGTLFNGGIYMAIAGAHAMTEDSMSGVAWWLGMFVVMVFVVVAYVVIIERSFRLIAWLPNAVMNVLDAWVSGIGVSESDTVGASDRRLAAGAGPVTRGLSDSNQAGREWGRSIGNGGTQRQIAKPS